MGTNYTPMIMPFSAIAPPIMSGIYNPANSKTKEQREKEAEEQRKKQEALKSEQEYMQRMKMLENQAAESLKSETESPLTKKEKRILKNAGLKLEEEEMRKSEGSLASAMLFAAPFLLPQAKSAIKPKKNTKEMFYNSGGAHMDLFNKNPDLMINAQEAMQKAERKFAKDIKAAKGNSVLVANIEAERDLFRNKMATALSSNDPNQIAKATEECKTAASVKNGRIRRFFRNRNGNPIIKSRKEAVESAERAGKFTSVKPPKSGASFLKTLRTNKSIWAMTAVMTVGSIAMDWMCGNIKKANAVDDKNKQNGKVTNYATDEIVKTGLKGAAGGLTYSIADTGARTLTKKYLGKFAAKLAAKIALRGGCKILGAAVGSVVPGAGTAIGLLVGTAADFLLNKFVLSNMDYFKEPTARKAELDACNDEELISQITEQYTMGNKLDKKTLSLLKKKCGKENFKELKRIHNMPEKERNEYLAQIQEQQAQIQEQQTQNQQSAQAENESQTVADV